MTYKIVAVTACVSGVAHTYMAAERLEALCKQKKWSIKVETQGALGTSNALTEDDIAQADIVLLITDIDLQEGKRFHKCRCIHCKTSTFLCNPHKVFSEINNLLSWPEDMYVCINVN